MTKIFERLRSAAAVLALGMLCACGESQSNVATAARLDATDVEQWKLPKKLAEISGLALDDQDRLFAHDDEQAVIHQIDWHRGGLVKSFALGDPPVRGDFEGIAVAGSRFYLMTSDGMLYGAAEGDDGAHVAYDRIDTGLGARCELEGLAYDAHRNVLLASCKEPRNDEPKGRVAVFGWSIEHRAVDAGSSMSIAEASLAGPIGERRFNPSSIEVSRDGAHVWLLAGRQHALAEVDRDGAVTAVTSLAAKRHRQPEGLAIGSSGELIIADEAAGDRATLAVYRKR
jgi:uncharacterized protein YjiK